jgi:hypothetical protein
MTETSVTPIKIVASATVVDDKGKKKLSIYIDPDFADALQKYARLNGISQGQIVDAAVKQSFFSDLMGNGKWRLGKR